MSRAATYLTYTGNTMYVLGTAAGATGTLYAVNRISGHGIKGLEAIPGFINSLTGPSRVQEAEQELVPTPDTPIAAPSTFLSVCKREFLGYCAIGGLISVGGFLVFAGKRLLAPETLEWANQLYK